MQKTTKCLDFSEMQYGIRSQVTYDVFVEVLSTAVKTIRLKK